MVTRLQFPLHSELDDPVS